MHFKVFCNNRRAIKLNCMNILRCNISATWKINVTFMIQNIQYYANSAWPILQFTLFVIKFMGRMSMATCKIILTLRACTKIFLLTFTFIYPVGNSMNNGVCYLLTRTNWKNYPVIVFSNIWTVIYGVILNKHYCCTRRFEAHWQPWGILQSWRSERR